MPTNHGESIVMRILDKEGLRLGLPELGFFTDDQQTFERLIGLPDGILLVTGPTGSGKTTTLYSCLNFINRPDRKIITVEDPVEYLLAGINQVQVNETVGLTFAAALRAMLRQAPNVIMMGEIRDLETADHRHQCLADRPPGLLHPAHQRRPQRRHPFDRHRGEAVPGGLLRPRLDGPAAGAQSVQEMRRALCAHRDANCNFEPGRRQSVRRNCSCAAKAATTAIRRAIAAVLAFLRYLSLTMRRAN